MWRFGFVGVIGYGLVVTLFEVCLGRGLAVCCFNTLGGVVMGLNVVFKVLFEGCLWM